MVETLLLILEAIVVHVTLADLLHLLFAQVVELLVLRVAFLFAFGLFTRSLKKSFKSLHFVWTLLSCTRSELPFTAKGAKWVDETSESMRQICLINFIEWFPLNFEQNNLPSWVSFRSVPAKGAVSGMRVDSSVLTRPTGSYTCCIGDDGQRNEGKDDKFVHFRSSNWNLKFPRCFFLDFSSLIF